MYGSTEDDKMSEEKVNVLCIKWGEKYGGHYANRLYNQVRKNLTLPFRFICLTDNKEGLHPEIIPLPIPDLKIEGPRGKTTWQKLGVFSPSIGEFTGPALFLDLDLIISGSLDPFFTYKPDKICIIHNWISPWKTLFRERPEIGNSSVFRFPLNECGYIVDYFQGEKTDAIEKWWPPQAYLTERIRDRMEYWPSDWVKSFKFHARPPFPLNFIKTAKSPEELGNPSIVAFHGRPNPDQALEGYKGKKLHHSVKPVTWIQDYWRD